MKKIALLILILIVIPASLALQYWFYDPEKEIITINYGHPAYLLELGFNQGVNEDQITVLDSTSVIQEEYWKENNLKLHLIGDPNKQGSTKIKSYVKPNIIKRDNEVVKELRANISDFDDDGIMDEIDNCPLSHNPDQQDSDKDGVGDSCEKQESQESRDRRIG